MASFRLDKSPWRDDYDLFNNDTLPLLKKHGKNIGSEDSDLARSIVKKYNMLYSSFDPITHMLLREDLIKWMNNNAKN